MPLGDAVLSAVREVQIPILAALLIGACAAKARRAIRAHCVDAALSPTAMFPLRLRKPVTMAMCACECALGAGLIATAGRAGAGLAATIARCGAALLFATAVGALNELRHRRPDVGCGCFGDLSETPVSMRTLSRSALLCAAALASLGVPPLRLPASAAEGIVLLAVTAAELLLIAALSPEVGEVLVRLGYSDPCEARRLPVTRTVASLRGSGPWRTYQRYLTALDPADIWREGCWRFLAYPAAIDGRTVDVVFGVYLQARRPQVRAAVVEAMDLLPAEETRWPGRSDAEILADSGAETAPAPVPRWTPRPAPTFTPALLPASASARASAHPLAHAAPRESAHVHGTTPEPVPWRRPRFMPRARAGDTERGHYHPAHKLHGSSSL